MSTSFNLPYSKRPGTDLTCKLVARNQQVIDIITSTIFNVEAGTYHVTESEWANGTRSDLFLVPDEITDEKRPLIIEFQKTVDTKFIKRAINYCIQASNRYEIDPVLLIFCIGTTSKPVEEKLENSIRLPCCATISCDLWAEECLILSKETIQQHINVEGPLNPLVALGMFLTYQASTITLLPRSEDPTIIFLYEITRKSFEEMHQKDVSISEELEYLRKIQIQEYETILSTIKHQKDPIDSIKEQVERKILEINKKKGFQKQTTTAAAASTATTTATPAPRNVYVEGMKFVDTFKKERVEK